MRLAFLELLLECLRDLEGFEKYLEVFDISKLVLKVFKKFLEDFH